MVALRVVMMMVVTVAEFVTTVDMRHEMRMNGIYVDSNHFTYFTLLRFRYLLIIVWDLMR